MLKSGSNSWHSWYPFRLGPLLEIISCWYRIG